MVVKESICCDIPVISVDVGDVRRWIDLASGCRLVNRDPVRIAAALREVLCGPRTVDGSAVRDQVSADRTAGQVLGVYRDVIARRAGLQASDAKGAHALR